MKTPAWRQDPAAYPLGLDIQPRYADEDGLNHINNISVAAYYDEARARMMRQVFEGVERGVVRIVTAESRVSYAGELFYPRTVDIRSGILRIGKSSFLIGQAAFQDGRYAGFCETTLVQASKAGAEPLHPVLRAAVEGLMIKGVTEA